MQLKLQQRKLPDKDIDLPEALGIKKHDKVKIVKMPNENDPLHDKTGTVELIVREDKQHEHIIVFMVCMDDKSFHNWGLSSVLVINKHLSHQRGIVAPYVLLVSTHFYLCEIYLGGLLSCLPELRSLPLIPCVSLVVVEIPVG